MESGRDGCLGLVLTPDLSFFSICERDPDSATCVLQDGKCSPDTGFEDDCDADENCVSPGECGGTVDQGGSCNDDADCGGNGCLYEDVFRVCECKDDICVVEEGKCNPDFDDCNTSMNESCAFPGECKVDRDGECEEDIECARDDCATPVPLRVCDCRGSTRRKLENEKGPKGERELSSKSPKSPKLPKTSKSSKTPKGKTTSTTTPRATCQLIDDRCATDDDCTDPSKPDCTPDGFCGIRGMVRRLNGRPKRKVQRRRRKIRGETSASNIMRQARL